MGVRVIGREGLALGDEVAHPGRSLGDEHQPRFDVADHVHDAGQLVGDALDALHRDAAVGLNVLDQAGAARLVLDQQLPERRLEVAGLLVLGPEGDGAALQFGRRPLPANQVQQVDAAVLAEAPALEHAVVVALGRLLGRVGEHLAEAQRRHDLVAPEVLALDDVATKRGRALLVLAGEDVAVLGLQFQQVGQRFLVGPVAEPALLVALRFLDQLAVLLGQPLDVLVVDQGRDVDELPFLRHLAGLDEAGRVFLGQPLHDHDDRRVRVGLPALHRRDQLAVRLGACRLAVGVLYFQWIIDDDAILYYDARFHGKIMIFIYRQAKG